MKKAGFVVLAALVFLLAVLAILREEVKSNRQRMAARPPLTPQEVERLVRPTRQQPVSPNDTAAPRSAEDKAPAKLARVLSPDETRRWMKTLTWQGNWRDRLRHAGLDVMATGVLGSGDKKSGGWFRAAALCAERNGDVMAAGEYFREALEYPMEDEYREECLSHLAWYQSDPRVAERMVEASCGGHNGMSFIYAIEFAEATGSTALRDHYCDLYLIHGGTRETLDRVLADLSRQRALVEQAE